MSPEFPRPDKSELLGELVSPEYDKSMRKKTSERVYEIFTIFSEITEYDRQTLEVTLPPVTNENGTLIFKQSASVYTGISAMSKKEIRIVYENVHTAAREIVFDKSFGPDRDLTPLKPREGKKTQYVLPTRELNKIEAVLTNVLAAASDPELNPDLAKSIERLSRE